MDCDENTWYLVKNTPKVTGFLGGNTPSPLSDAEVQNVVKQMRGEVEKPKPKVEFEKGENIRVIDGPFVNFTGVIDEVHPDRGKLKVMVSIFGRTTPVELEMLQVEKV
jgi:transcriptional antiterminator NusG